MKPVNRVTRADTAHVPQSPDQRTLPPTGYPTSPIEPQLRVEVRVSYVHADSGIAVPLGCYYQGKWRGIPLGEDCFVMDPAQLAEGLSHDEFLGPPLLHDDGFAERAAGDTWKRCIALAEAACIARQAAEARERTSAGSCNS